MGLLCPFCPGAGFAPAIDNTCQHVDQCPSQPCLSTQYRCVEGEVMPYCLCDTTAPTTCGGKQTCCTSLSTTWCSEMNYGRRAVEFIYHATRKLVSQPTVHTLNIVCQLILFMCLCMCTTNTCVSPGVSELFLITQPWLLKMV